MSQLFLDMDGVLADFDGYYTEQFGLALNRNRPDEQHDPPDLWANIRGHKTFYRDLPILPDARQLWDATKQYNPIILTGVPAKQVPDAERQKREWVQEHFGCRTCIICCRSRDKCLYGRPGDVLIDDWQRYRNHWEKMGGIFILHESAEKSLAALAKVWS